MINQENTTPPKRNMTRITANKALPHIHKNTNTRAQLKAIMQFIILLPRSVRPN